MSVIRQNYSPECEAAVNKEINSELHAAYVYISMAYHFDRHDMALHGFHKFFKESSDNCRAKAEMLMKYQNSRGGRIALQEVHKPQVTEWEDGLSAVKHALELEKSLNQGSLDLHEIAERQNDYHLTDWLEHEMLRERTERLKIMGNHVTNLTRVISRVREGIGGGLGEYQFDEETLLKSA